MSNTKTVYFAASIGVLIAIGNIFLVTYTMLEEEKQQEAELTSVERVAEFADSYSKLMNNETPSVMHKHNIRIKCIFNGAIDQYDINWIGKKAYPYNILSTYQTYTDINIPSVDLKERTLLARYTAPVECKMDLIEIVPIENNILE